MPDPAHRVDGLGASGGVTFASGGGPWELPCCGWHHLRMEMDAGVTVTFLHA